LAGSGIFADSNSCERYQYRIISFAPAIA
jgi:hypothetical protein